MKTLLLLISCPLLAQALLSKVLRLPASNLVCSARIIKENLPLGPSDLQPSAFTCDGDINKLQPTGASATTAKKDQLKSKGVVASRQLVNRDLQELQKLKQCFDKVGKKHCLHPSLIAALVSRESRAGRVLRTIKGQPGWGDCREDECRAYGLLQCDIYSSELGEDGCLAHLWDSCEHVDMMISKALLPDITAVQAKFPTWPKERQLQGGVAAYNCGIRQVKAWPDVDEKTTGEDYSNDVVARAQYLIKNQGWK